jgi:hypothetical protein
MRMNSEIYTKLKLKDSLMKFRRKNMRLKKEIIGLNAVEKREKLKLLVSLIKTATSVTSLKKTITGIVQGSLS